MRMSTKGRFAIDALIDMTLRQDHGPVPLASISSRQQVSLSYLEQIFGQLRRVGLVESTRGPGGGYSLSCAPHRISVADIICAVDDPQAGSRTGLSGELWSQLNEVMMAHMATITLDSLVSRHRTAELSAEAAPSSQPAPAPSPAQRRPMGDGARLRAWVGPAESPGSRRPPGQRGAGIPNSVFAFGRSFASGA
jgi:Rrf2 family iron-sulfur cluster assembly transcriptional regulator